jgi:pimeloyl-ACP methyl ester carboxylesterase
VPEAVIDGIVTRYEVVGSGPPLLMFAPGGLHASLDNWTGHGRYRRLKLLDHLPAGFRCIRFDRRESGRSGGRVERVSWRDYAAQGRGLLAHLGIGRAHLLGGCAGCSVAAAFAVAYPAATASMVLFSPAGGPRYRLLQHARFAAHEVFVREHGLPAVAELARSGGRHFGEDPRVGPWASVIRGDAAFASGYAGADPEHYLLVVRGMARTLFDRDTVPGAEPEDLLRLRVAALVVPGQDASHATSAARYLEECLPGAQYWDVPVPAQTGPATAARLLGFLRSAE